MKKIIFIALLFCFNAKAVTFNSINDGDWNDNQTWGSLNSPNPTDTVLINHAVTWSPNNNTTWRGKMHIKINGSLIITCPNFRFWNNSLDINGVLLVRGNITFDKNSTVTIHNNIDSVRIYGKLIAKDTNIKNYTTKCGLVSADSVSIDSTALFEGNGIYLTNDIEANQVPKDIFFSYCRETSTGIVDPRRIMKENEPWNFNILGQKIR